jgi:hypothetical protein
MARNNVVSAGLGAVYKLIKADAPADKRSGAGKSDTPLSGKSATSSAQ